MAGIEFEDERVAFPDWKELKPKTPYGQLPLLSIDGAAPRTQSMAMLRYVATLYPSLYPSDKVFDIEEALGVVDDVRQSWNPNLYMGMRPENYGYPEGFAKTEEGKALVQSMRETWIKEKMPGYLDNLCGLLKKNENQFLASTDAPTIVDCICVPFLRSFTRGHMDHVPATALDSHPEIVAYVKRVCAVQGVAGRYTDGLF